MTRSKSKGSTSACMARSSSKTRAGRRLLVVARPQFPPAVSPTANLLRARCPLAVRANWSPDFRALSCFRLKSFRIGRGPTVVEGSEYPDCRSGSYQAEHGLHVAGCQCHAARCRLEFSVRRRACDMKEDGAAMSHGSGTLIVAQHANDVVETVVAPEGFGAGVVRVADKPVVVSIPLCVAPSVFRTNRLDAKARRPAPADRSPVDSQAKRHDSPSPARRGAVTFALPPRATRPPECTAELKAADLQPADLCAHRKASYDQVAHELSRWLPAECGLSKAASLEATTKAWAVRCKMVACASTNEHPGVFET